MRLWIFVLLAILFVGVLVAIQQAGVFDTITRRNVRADEPTFRDYEAGSIRYLDEKGKRVFVAQLYPDAPQILSGFPSYVGTTFQLPVDARPLNGSYNLFFQSQAVRGTEGAVRISINGIRRADTVLRPGPSRQRVVVDLTPTELAAGELDVRIGLIGHGPMEECTPNEALAAVVNVLPQTGLRLRLDKPPSSVRDRLALWGDLVPVKWTRDDRDEPMLTLISAARLHGRGYGVYFGNTGYAGNALAGIAKEASGHPVRRPDLRYPISLVSASENAGARRFDRETTWRYRYDLAQLPNGELPAALDLRLALGPVADTRTALFVTLNNHLLLTRQIGESDERFNTSIALPKDDQMERNEVEVTLTATERDEMRCGSRRLIAAEMLPGTVLRGGGERMVTPLAQLRTLVRANQPVALNPGTLTPPQAQTTAMLLGQLDPTALSFATSGFGTGIEVLTGNVAAALSRVRPDGRQWIIYYPTDEREGAVATRLAPDTSVGDAALALLVTVRRAGATPSAAKARTSAPPRATADAAK